MNTKINTLMLVLSSFLLIFLTGCHSPSTLSPYGHFERVGDLNIARAGHTATLLKDGRVLIAGGDSTCFAHYNNGNPQNEGIGCTGALKSLEIYDPKSRKFSLAGNLYESHEMPNAPLLSDGRVVFIGAPGTHAEIYDPATGQVTLSGKMLIPRKDHTVTLLRDGNILIVGGEVPRLQGSVTVYDQPTNSAEIFHSKTGKFAFTGKLNYSRSSHRAVLLSSGEVLILKGDWKPNRLYETAEFYNPLSEKFKLATFSLPIIVGGKAVLLNDNKVFLFAGMKPINQPENYMELIDINKNTVVSTKSVFSMEHPTVVPLNKNKLLLFGGHQGAMTIKSVFIYDLNNNSFLRLEDMPERIAAETATMLKDGNILLAGGHKYSNFKKIADLFINTEGK